MACILQSRALQVHLKTKPILLMKSLFKNPILSGLAPAFLLIVLIVSAGRAQTYDTTGYFYITSISQAGKSLAFVKKDSSITVKTTVADSPTQLWKWEPVKMEGITGYYRIVNKQLGSDLYLTADKVGDDIIVRFYPKKETTGQLWRREDNEDNSRLITMYSNKCLQATSTGGLECREKTDSPAYLKDQMWKLTPQKTDKAAVAKPVQAVPVAVITNPSMTNKAEVSPAKKGLDTAAVYRIITNEMPDKSLGIGAPDGRSLPVMLVPASNHPLQEWKLVLNANGFYQINNQYYPSKSLEVSLPNETVIINDTNSSNNKQFWKIVLTHEGAYQVTSVSQGGAKPLDFVEDGEVENIIQLREFNSTIWSFIQLRSTAPAAKPEVKQVAVRNNKNKLMVGEQLKENAKLISANGEYSLVQQPDGNLVIYNTQKKAMWASGMDGKNVKRCVMQKDGNLAQHPGGYDLITWSTNTKGNAGAYAMLQDDGVLVIINKDDKIIWSSKN